MLWKTHTAVVLTRSSSDSVSMPFDFFFFFNFNYLHALQVLPKSQHVLEAPAHYWIILGFIPRVQRESKMSDVVWRSFRTQGHFSWDFFFSKGLSFLSFDILLRKVISFKPLSLKRTCSLKCSIKVCRNCELLKLKCMINFKSAN